MENFKILPYHKLLYNNYPLSLCNKSNLQSTNSRLKTRHLAWQKRQSTPCWSYIRISQEQGNKTTFLSLNQSAWRLHWTTPAHKITRQHYDTTVRRLREWQFHNNNKRRKAQLHGNMRATFIMVSRHFWKLTAINRFEARLRYDNQHNNRHKKFQDKQPWRPQQAWQRTSNTTAQRSFCAAGKIINDQPCSEYKNLQAVHQSDSQGVYLTAWHPTHKASTTWPDYTPTQQQQHSAVLVVSY